VLTFRTLAIFRVTRVLLASCALIAVLCACLVNSTAGPGSDGDSSDDISAPDLSETMPVTPFVLQVAPEPTARAIVHHVPPLSRLASVEIFRPPRALG
jgi:hypothetical protein